MAARLSSLFARTSARRAFTPTTFSSSPAARSFQISTIRTQEVVGTTPPAVKKPVGAFRGTIFGFLLGSVIAGSGLYYYVVDEYKVSNELLTEDIYALQSAVQRLEGYVKGLEEQMVSKK